MEDRSVRCVGARPREDHRGGRAPRHLGDRVRRVRVSSIGFFLPGDALLFTAGFFASAPESIPDELHLPLVPLIVGIVACAIVGDQVGYLFGRALGPALFSRPDSRFFKQQNVDKAHAYFERYGPRTIVLARFVPIVRTFAPIVAGVSGMEYRTFVRWNVIGGVLWGVGVTLLGYFLGQIDVIAENIELTIVVIVAISCLPIALELWRAPRRHPADASDDSGRATPVHLASMDDDPGAGRTTILERTRWRADIDAARSVPRRLVPLRPAEAVAAVGRSRTGTWRGGSGRPGLRGRRAAPVRRRAGAS